MPTKYTDEFKRDAVSLVLTQGMTQKQVARDLGVSKSALQVWVKNAELEDRGFTPSADPEDRREMLQAMKRIQELEMENEVLRRAAAYLSQANLKLGSMPKK